MTDKELVSSLRSKLCPSCGQQKRQNNTLCKRCYFSLSDDLRRNLYNPLGHGYAEAVQAALEDLGVDLIACLPGGGEK